MELTTLTNPIPSAAGELDHEGFKLSARVPRELLENDALTLAFGGGNVQDVALYQVLNDLGPLASVKGVDAKDTDPDVGALAWAALPVWLASQGVETGAPTSLWCKDGH